MDFEVAKALELAKEKVGDGESEDFELLIDISDMCFVWVSEKVAKLSGRTVSEMIGSRVFDITRIPAEELRDILVRLKKGGKLKLPLTTKDGRKKVLEMVFTPIYVTRDRPFLVAKIIE